MEDKDNDDLGDNENNVEKEEEKEIEFDKSLLNDIDILPQLSEYLSNQKKFMSFINTQLKKCYKDLIEEEEKKLIDKIFSFIIKNAEALGIPFSFLLIKDQELKNIIFNMFFDNKYKEEILSIIKKIIDIFNFEYSNINTLTEYYKELIDKGIINENDLKVNEKRESLTEEEDLFEKLETILFYYKSNREIGNEMEKDEAEHLNCQLDIYEKDIDELKSQETIPRSIIQFYEERIEEVKNFRDKKDILEEKENNINKIHNEIKDFKEEKEEDEINMQEKIIEDIRELRKQPLNKRTYFYKEEQIIEDENELIEYKNYYLPLGDIQKQELRRQFCSFFNSNGGRLYIGINDQKIIKGVRMHEKEKSFKNNIVKLLVGFSPEINQNEFLKFFFIPVKNNKTGVNLKNLYVIKIRIKKGDPSILYSISNKGFNSTIRLQGQCANLTAEEIHKQIIERKKLKNKTINENNFDMDDDPEPINNDNDNEEKQKSKIYKTNENFIKIEEKDNKSNTNNDKNMNNNININNKNEDNNPVVNKSDNKKNEDNYIDMDEFNEYIINNKKEQEDLGNISNKSKKSKNSKNSKNSQNSQNSNKNKKKKKKNNEIIRVNIYNIDKKADKNELYNLIGQFNCIDIKTYETQNEIKGYIDFNKEENADNCIKNLNNTKLGKKSMILKKVSFDL